MDAKELRIGNIVKYADSVYLHGGKITEIGDIIQGETDYYEPIPLTEEWLLKLGFEKEKDENINYRYYLSCDEFVIIAYDLDDKCIRISESWEFGKRQFVHQLQNLYFELTNEELTIKN